jgi:hypothetical protein
MVFGIFRKKINPKKITQQIIVFILNNEYLSKPQFVPHLSNEAGAERLGENLPLIFIWNENRISGTFSVSINGPLIGQMVEKFLNRKHPQFNETRDLIMRDLSAIAEGSIVETCNKLQVCPSDIFPNFVLENEWRQTSG